MAGKKLQSAKQKRMIDNTIVHIVLAVLAVIWLLGNPYKFPCGKRLLCINLLPKSVYT